MRHCLPFILFLALKSYMQQKHPNSQPVQASVHHASQAPQCLCPFSCCHDLEEGRRVSSHLQLLFPGQSITHNGAGSFTPYPAIWKSIMLTATSVPSITSGTSQPLPYSREGILLQRLQGPFPLPKVLTRSPCYNSSL